MIEMQGYKKRPDCSVCGKKESGFVLMAGNKLVCRECFLAYEKALEDEQNRIFDKIKSYKNDD